MKTNTNLTKEKDELVSMHHELQIKIKKLEDNIIQFKLKNNLNKVSENEIIGLNEKIKKLEKMLQQEICKRVNIEKVKDDEIKFLKEQIDALTLDNTSLQRNLKENKNKISEFRTTKIKYENELNSIKSLCNTQKSELNARQKQLQLLRSEVNDYRRKVIIEAENDDTINNLNEGFKLFY